MRRNVCRPHIVMQSIVISNDTMWTSMTTSESKEALVMIFARSLSGWPHERGPQESGDKEPEA